MLQNLAYLIALARERSFRRAAEACNVAQPTLSAGIKHLEDDLGTLLVLRSSRFHGLTPEGEKALEWAKRLVGDARAMRQDLTSLKGGLAGHLRIAVIPTALTTVPALTTPVLQRHPALQFTITSCTSDEVLERLDNLEADAGITYLGLESIGRLQSVPLYTERYRLVTTASSPLGHRDAVPWADLAAIPLCLLAPDMQNRRIMDRIMHSVGAQFRTTLQSNSQVTLIAHVLQGPWSTILPEHLVHTLALPPHLRAIPLTTPDAAAQVGLVVPDRDPLPTLAAALFAEARRLHPIPDQI